MSHYDRFDFLMERPGMEVLQNTHYFDLQNFIVPFQLDPLTKWVITKQFLLLPD